MALNYSMPDKGLIVIRFNSGERVIDLCAGSNISESTLYNWIRQHDSNYVKADGSPITVRAVHSLRIETSSPAGEFCFLSRSLRCFLNVSALCSTPKDDSAKIGSPPAVPPPLHTAPRCNSVFRFPAPPPWRRPEKVQNWASVDPEKLSVMAWRMISAASWPVTLPLEIMSYMVASRVSSGIVALIPRDVKENGAWTIHRESGIPAELDGANAAAVWRPWRGRSTALRRTCPGAGRW